MRSLTSFAVARACAAAAPAFVSSSFFVLGPAAAQSPPPTRLDPIVVTASPFDARTERDVAQPVSILSGDGLRARESTNLGATLTHELGVQSSSYGAGAGRPIIRSMDSARVGITESGIGVADVSSMSPDHRVAADTFNARQVEILRGPATLLYGSGAIGGLVNIVTERIPLERLDGFGGDVRVRAASADRERLGVFSLEAPIARAGALHIEGFDQDTRDYKLAAPLRAADGTIIAHDRLPNSASEARSISAGASWIGDDRSMLGFAVQRYRSTYGIPNIDEPVTIDLSRDRVDVRGDWMQPFAGVTRASMRVAHSDYEHTEFEPDGAAGAHFENRGVETRLDLTHAPIGGWTGVIGTQISDMRVRGSGEGTLPETDARAFALFIVEERRVGPWRLELGARGERARYDVREDDAFGVRKPSRDFSLFSASGAAFYTLAEGWDVGGSLTTSQRAPSADALYFEGAHPATFAYEIGNPDLARERSRNIELSLRRTSGPVRGAITVFEHRFRDYIYGAFDGTTTDELDEDGNVEASWANLRQRQDDARFRGIEAEVRTGARSGWQTRVWGDLVRAVLRSGPNAGSPLPRTAPARLGFDLGWRNDAWSVGTSLVHVFAQRRTASFDVRDGVPETETGSATTLDVVGRWRVRLADFDAVLSLEARNLTDEDVRVHTSFLKDRAPLPGRSFVVGLGARF